MRALVVQPGQLQGSGDQALHAVDLLQHAPAQSLGIQAALAGHAQAAERSAQLVGQIAQQLALQRYRGLQALGHMVEGAAQLTQFVTPQRHVAGPGAEVIGVQGVGLLA